MTETTDTAAARQWRWRRQQVLDVQDNVFDADGTVRLPKLAGLAVTLSLVSEQPLSNQPTRERAEAVAAASADVCAAKGARAEVVQRGDRWIVRAVRL